MEIWDVVDKGRKRRPLDGLKLNGALQVTQVPEVVTALDAEFIDVYKVSLSDLLDTYYWRPVQWVTVSRLAGVVPVFWRLMSG